MALAGATAGVFLLAAGAPGVRSPVRPAWARAIRQRRRPALALGVPAGQRADVLGRARLRRGLPAARGARVFYGGEWLSGGCGGSRCSPATTEPAPPAAGLRRGGRLDVLAHRHREVHRRPSPALHGEGQRPPRTAPPGVGGQAVVLLGPRIHSFAVGAFLAEDTSRYLLRGPLSQAAGAGTASRVLLGRVAPYLLGYGVPAVSACPASSTSSTGPRMWSRAR